MTYTAHFSQKHHPLPFPYVLTVKTAGTWRIFLPHAKPKSRRHSIRIFTSRVTLTSLNDPQVKLVIVCTHADSHFEYANALEAGKNVLVEKLHPNTGEAKSAICAGEAVDGHALPESPFDSCFTTKKV